MRNKGEIPEELLKFFEDENGKTMLIKGSPGTGKTIFALTLLSILKGDGIYLSTRVDPEMLYLTCPWIKDEISRNNIVDATRSERPSVKRTTAIKPLKYTDAPEFLRNVYERTEDMENPIVIIDSWDAVASYTGYYEPKDRERLEHNLCDFARKTGTKMIFIAEYTEQKSLDYLVDGVVITEYIQEDGRILRRMFIQKLRGCAIRNPFALFTLNDGVFKSFKCESLHEKIRELKEPAVPEPIADPDGRISTGITELDYLLGGYGYLNIFEGDFIPFKMLAQSAAMNCLNSGKKVCVDEMQRDMIEEIMPFISEDKRENVIFERNAVENVDCNMIIADINDVDVNMKELYARLRDKKCFALCYARDNAENAQKIRHIASTYIKTRCYMGVPCMYAENPITKVHALEWDVSSGYPTLRATPIE